jgi:formiminoglutamase
MTHSKKKGVWQGRVDSETDSSAFRLHQCVQEYQLEQSTSRPETLALLGFSSDEGVKRNNGRPGAVDGPDHFRSVAAGLCWHTDLQHAVADIGNISVHGSDLESAHQQLSIAISKLLSQGKKPFVIGGGHETAYGHMRGIIDHLKNTEEFFSLGVLNIDAHFDLRDYTEGAHSGSSFSMILDEAKVNQIPLSYFVYGLNQNSNTALLFDKAKEYSVTYATNEEVLGDDEKAMEKIYHFIKQHSHIYLSVCLDVFDVALAPGVSAPAWAGIRYEHMLPIFKILKQTDKLISMDICELNPNLDKENRTAKLAASLFAKYAEK